MIVMHCNHNYIIDDNDDNNYEDDDNNERYSRNGDVWTR